MAKKLGFTKWLKQQHNRNDRVGDLASDVRVDRDWPKASTFRKFEGYLESISACDGARKALRQAWTEWLECNI